MCFMQQVTHSISTVMSLVKAIHMAIANLKEEKKNIFPMHPE